MLNKNVLCFFLNLYNYINTELINNDKIIIKLARQIINSYIYKMYEMHG